MQNNIFNGLKQKDLYQVSLKLILKNNNNEILILNAMSGGTFKGFYDLPGGRIDVDEFTTDFVEILKREVREELGEVNIEISNMPVSYGRHRIPPSFSDTGYERHVLYLFFEARYIDGDIVISEEHTGYKWIDIEKIKLEEYFNSGILQGMKMYNK